MLFRYRDYEAEVFRLHENSSQEPVLPKVSLNEVTDFVHISELLQIKLDCLPIGWFFLSFTSCDCSEGELSQQVMQEVKLKLTLVRCIWS